MAPNMFHVGVQENVSIAVFDAGLPVTVKLYLQDYPHRRKTFSQVQGQVDQGKFKLFFEKCITYSYYILSLTFKKQSTVNVISEC